MTGANCHVKLCQSKQLLKNIHSVMLAQFRPLKEKIFTTDKPKPPKNHQLYATAATKKKDVATKRLRTRSTFNSNINRQDTSLTLVDHGVN